MIANVDDVLGFASHPHDSFDPSDLRSAARYFKCIVGAPVVGFETLRENFVGTYGTYQRPAALERGSLTNFETAGENMVGSQQPQQAHPPQVERETYSSLVVAATEADIA